MTGNGCNQIMQEVIADRSLGILEAQGLLGVVQWWLSGRPCLFLSL